jgi:hypothetical protein
MARYYFDINNGHPYRDEVGEDLANDAAAWMAAKRLTRDIENVLAPGQSWNLEVRRRDENPIFRIRIETELIRQT